MIPAKYVIPRRVGFVSRAGREVGELAGDGERVLEDLADRPALATRGQIEMVRAHLAHDVEL